MTTKWTRTMTPEGTLVEDCGMLRRKVSGFPRIGDNVCRFDIFRLTRAGWAMVSEKGTPEESDRLAAQES